MGAGNDTRSFIILYVADRVLELIKTWAVVFFLNTIQEFLSVISQFINYNKHKDTLHSVTLSLQDMHMYLKCVLPTCFLSNCRS